MQVSLINLNLVGPDAIGMNMVHQARFFQRSGHDVHLFVEHPPEWIDPGVAEVTAVCSLSDLIGGRQPFFTGSDLFIYHYPTHYGLLESIKGLDYGAVLFDYHGVTPPELWGSDHDRESLIRGIEGVALVHHADLAMVHSTFSRQELIERSGYPADQIRILPLAVPLDQFHPGGPDPALIQRYDLGGRHVLLYVGRMAGNKRIDLLVRALPQVQAEVPGTRLLLVGDDRSSPAYVAIVEQAKALARDLGVAHDVIFTGRVEDVASCYRLADVCVTSSLHEGFCMPVIEAMASGVPVVGSRSTALPETIGEAGLTFAPGDVADLARQVVTILRDGGLRAELARKGIERARTYSLAEYESRLGPIIEEATRYVPRTAKRTGYAPTQPASSVSQPSPEIALQLTELAALAQEAAVGQPGYVVRSNKPLIGPLIAWVRRNLTSHLREPYLDPVIERQVRFNTHLVAYLRQLAGDLSRARATALEQKSAPLEETWAKQLTGLQTASNVDPDELQQRLALVEQSLAQIPEDTWEKLDRLYQLLRGSNQAEPDSSDRASRDRVGGEAEIEED